MAITFVIADGRTKNDVDNLAKNLLDVLQGFAYQNDEQIEHLDLMRINSHSTETFMAIRIAVADLNGLRDVINPEFRLGWIGPPPVDMAKCCSGRAGVKTVSMC